MGDRTNTVFRMADGSDIVLYQHWGGENMMHNLATALDAARSRWNDESYATRIIISNLIGDNWASETGYGISTTIQDNEHSVPVLDFSDNTVALYDFQFMSHGCELRDQKFRMPFGEFVKKFSKVLTTA
jgi:menaquinone-dependent protoporphyrinogen IX oxidase